MSFSVKKLRDLIEDLPDHALVMVESLGDTLVDAYPEYIENIYYRLDDVVQCELSEDSFGRKLTPLKILLIR